MKQTKGKGLSGFRERNAIGIDNRIAGLVKVHNYRSNMQHF